MISIVSNQLKIKIEIKIIVISTVMSATTDGVIAATTTTTAIFRTLIITLLPLFRTPIAISCIDSYHYYT